MQQLLSVRSKRILNILNHLLENNKGCLISDLAKINDCTVQTVYNDVKYVKNHFSKFIQLDHLGNTLRMEYYSVGSLLEVKKAFLAETVCLNILINIYLNPECTISSLASTLHYSEVHIRTKIKEINSVLSPFSFKIEITKHQTLTFNNTNNLHLAYFIALIMKLAGNSVKSHLSQDTLSSIESSATQFNLPQEIHDYLVDIACVYTYKFEDSEDFFDLFNQILNTTSVQSASDICISELTNYKNGNISLETQDFMRNSASVLIALSQLQPQIIDNFFNRYDIFYKMFKQDNSKFCEKFEAVLESINSNYDIDMDKVRSKIIYHMVIHIQNINIRKSLRIGVYSDLGLSHSEVLVQRIKNRFDEHSVFSLKSLDDFEDADFVCSTIILSELPSEKVAIINDYITTNDMLIIYTKTKEILSNNKK